MLARIISKALWERRHRVALALAALTVSSTLATALLGLYSDIDRKLRGQFQGYGANLVISPAGDRQTISLRILDEAARYGPATPFLYSVETVNGEPAVLAGVDFRTLEPLTAYWQVAGSRVPPAGECLAGERFRTTVGSNILIAGRPTRVAGVISTGAAEDSQVMLPIEEVAARSGRNGEVSRIDVRVDGNRVETARQELAAAHPEAEVRVLRAMVASEANVILRIRNTLFLLTVLVLFITALCVMNNFGAIVYQRRKEIGILKAIGGSDRRIAAMFASEAVLMGMIGSLAGFVLGWLLARWLGWEIFRQPVPPGLATLPAVVGITLVVALAATILPLRQIRKMEPAVILRGE